MQPKRSGVTFTELLIVVLIVATLAGLTLVGIQAARESSRRAVCESNFRQIGLALQSYASSHGVYPPAVIWGPAGEPLGGGVIPIGVIDRVAKLGRVGDDRIYSNWLIMLLPQLDQDALHRQIVPELPIGHSRNAAARRQELPVSRCPTDAYHDARNHFLRGGALGIGDNEYARGNIAMNVGPDAGCLAGMGTPEAPCSNGFLLAGGDLQVSNNRLWGSGIGGVNYSVAPRDVSDGLSYTVAVDEIRAGIDAIDPRGVWALGQVGASAVARHGQDGDGQRPNSTNSGSEELIGCATLRARLGDRLKDEGMPCYLLPDPSEEINAQSVPRSMHWRGVNVLHCDGSLHYISNSIDTAAWHAMHTRAGHEPFAVSE